MHVELKMSFEKTKDFVEQQTFKCTQKSKYHPSTEVT